MNLWWKPGVEPVVQRKLTERLSQKEGDVQYLLIPDEWSLQSLQKAWWVISSSQDWLLPDELLEEEFLEEDYQNNTAS